ncbi:hypothetical protein A2W78_00860 [Candidatus Nomurabacteria bacterium RIFCSPLOWO2_12_40_14]|nr:MAG: hypothetical protein A2W43_03370 [Candidatus Nomurabacteria bacterium RIFCSPHIGHO2_12_40_11]OGI99059.1 MAG: hypothetical protein A2W78_00860 [Candidatus Nomurabacteria bacterium RIFCSPLOWO2_12_40_14]
MGLLNGTKWGQPPFFFALPSESALKPRHTARILGGQNPKKKNVLSILEKTTPAKTKSKEHFFFLGLPSGARWWWGFRGAYNLI